MMDIKQADSDSLVEFEYESYNEWSRGLGVVNIITFIMAVLAVAFAAGKYTQYKQSQTDQSMLVPNQCLEYLQHEYPSLHFTYSERVQENNTDCYRFRVDENPDIAVDVQQIAGEGYFDNLRTAITTYAVYSTLGEYVSDTDRYIAGFRVSVPDPAEDSAIQELAGKIEECCTNVIDEFTQMGLEPDKHTGEITVYINDDAVSHTFSAGDTDIYKELKRALT